MKTNNEELDVITLELIDNAMGSIMAQMTLTVIYAASTAASVESTRRTRKPASPLTGQLLRFGPGGVGSPWKN